jgi:AGZA family xanthine/uracil permease-like MFS transporter
MGENAFIAFGLAALGITWQQRLGAVFVSGLVFLVVTLLGVRQWLADSISPSMKHSFVAGIGLFLALIGLYEAGIVTSFVTGMPGAALTDPVTGLLRAPDVPLKIGDLHDPRPLLAVGGLLVIVALLHFRVRGAMLIGIVTTALGGAALGFGKAPTGIVAIPFRGEYDISPVAFQLDVPGVLHVQLLPILLTLFLLGFLDTLGSLIGVGAAGNMLDEKGNFPNIKRPMIVDALSCMVSGLVGTSTSGAYIESATGIREGARTGLAALTTAGLFALALFFIPLFEPLQSLSFAYAPALMAVGFLMIGSIARIDFTDLTEAVPAFATVAMIVFTYNIGNGITSGLLLYPIVKAATGRFRELNGGSIALGLASAAYFLFGLPH